MAIVPIKKIQQKMEAKINTIDYIILGYLLTEWATLPALVCLLVIPHGYEYMATVSSRTINKQTSNSQ